MTGPGRSLTPEALETAAHAAFLAGKARSVRAAFWDDPDCDRDHWRKIALAVIKATAPASPRPEPSP